MPPSTQCECGCCLYGPYAGIPYILGAAATVLSWIVTFDCRYFRSEFSLRFGSSIQVSRGFSVGPWLVEEFAPNDIDYSTCVTWETHATLSDDDIDAPLRVGRVATLFVSLAALFHFFTLALTLCMALDGNLLRFMALSSLVFGVGCILTLVMLASDEFCQSASHCELDQDGYMAIGAAVTWWLLGAALFYMPAPSRIGSQPGGSSTTTTRPPAQQPPPPETTTTTVTQSQAPDGTVTIVTTKTTTLADGSRSVTETREIQRPNNSATGTTPPPPPSAPSFVDEENDVPLVDAIPVKDDDGFYPPPPSRY